MELGATLHLKSKLNSEYIGQEMAVAYKPTQVGGYEYGTGDLPFRKRDWRGRSEELKNLISQCLEVDPEKRITAEDALQHPFFTIQV